MAIENNYSEIIKNSVQTDKHICRWSLALVVHPIASKILFAEPSACKNYKTFKTYLKILRVLSCLTALSLILAAIFYKLWWLALATLTLFIISKKCHSILKKYLADMAWRIIEKDIPDLESRQPAFYQISEVLSKKYYFSSLVDNLSFYDKASTTFLLGGTAILIIFSPHSWHTLAKLIILLAAYQVFSFFIGHPVNLKKNY